MKSFAVAAALAGAAMAAPQAVTSAIAPAQSAPAGCSPNYSGTFELYVVKAGASKAKRDSTPLEITLKNGVLTDAKGRTGYIASNNQFQFDGPVQAGAIYTAGWSVCQNTSLALGDSTVFYQCLSGDFYNLYDENSAAQCSPIELQALGGSVSGAASQQGDGQVTAGQAHTVLCQIGDGQIQQNTCITTMYPVTQIGDGQIQAPTGTPVGQISDGQVQAPTGTPVGQISDGQVQAPTASPVSQIGDGQIQAPTGSSNATVPVMTATTKASSTASAYTGAAVLPTLRAELLGLAAGIVAIAAL